MGSACSQPQSGFVRDPNHSSNASSNDENKPMRKASVMEETRKSVASPAPAAASAETAAKPDPAATPKPNSNTSAIDKMMTNMAKREEQKQKTTAPSKDKKGDAPPAGSDAAMITNDEHGRIVALMNSPMMQAITPEIVKIVRETWELAMQRADFAVAFYNDLLTKHRSATEAIFYGVDIVLQAGRLVKMIEGAINLLETPKSLVPVIIRLGSRHVAYGTTTQHFVLVTNSLTDLILETVGPEKITPEIIQHWRLVLGLFQQIMEAGYGTSAGKGVGKKHHSRIQRTLLKCWKSSVAGHLKQLKQAGGSAPLPDVQTIIHAAQSNANMKRKIPFTTTTTTMSAANNNNTAAANNNNNNHNGASAAAASSGGGEASPATAQSAPTNAMTYSHLFFGVPSSITEAMIGAAMKQFILNGGDKINPMSSTSSNGQPLHIPLGGGGAGGTQMNSQSTQHALITSPSYPRGDADFEAIDHHTQADNNNNNNKAARNNSSKYAEEKEVSIDVSASPVAGNTTNATSGKLASAATAAAPPLPTSPTSTYGNVNATLGGPNGFSGNELLPNGPAKMTFEGIAGVPMNHLLAPSVSSTALTALTKLPPNEFDALIQDAFEIGLSHVEDDMPYFEKNRKKTLADMGVTELDPSKIPPTLQASEWLYNRMQMTGKLLVQIGAKRGDLESFNESFVKSALFFASPEWNNPFVRDQMARFWMKFCSFIGSATE